MDKNWIRGGAEQGERAFRSLKTVVLNLRPIHHRHADRGCAHLILGMHAYCVEWRMREACGELMFADSDQEARTSGDPLDPGHALRSRVYQVHLRHPSATTHWCTALAP